MTRASVRVGTCVAGAGGPCPDPRHCVTDPLRTWSALEALRELWLDRKGLSGPTPSDVAQMAELESLGLNRTQPIGRTGSALGPSKNLARLGPVTTVHNVYSSAPPACFGC